MAKSKDMWKQAALFVVYWAIYLTATMAFFERFNIHPATVPYGAVGWAIIVEVPRVALGYLIGIPVFKAFKK
jgi:hypothetical protein